MRRQVNSVEVFNPGARQISSDRFNVVPLAQKVARPHPGLLPQEKGQKKSVGHPLTGGAGQISSERVKI
jgi:hypothetical protein